MRSAVARRLHRLRDPTLARQPQEVCRTWGWVFGDRRPHTLRSALTLTASGERARLAQMS